MNRRLLQKVIDAITEGKLEYAMGILDTLMEGLPEDPGTIQGLKIKGEPELMCVGNKIVPKVEIKDEGAYLDQVAKAKLEKVKSMVKYD